ncbi:hypothetical protein CNYM01_00526 [Colletotrichum nymphaeae SA-01]|uniref:BTB domain-containing protein n=1 Tax=Colletotrichum nymphaeae SA-01 TaxID=1460502 RepID=A0A135TVS5_9PEZI|nr:hypothetical protein CNYM01_00526 [Colletotrichum nymphaeae SA-01]
MPHTRQHITMGNFGSSDGQLLKSGKFSDCKVRCDGTTWNCHKSILCMRSDYFLKNLGEDWPAGKTGVSKITCFTAEQMDWTISYIYTGEFDFHGAEKNKTILNSAVQLWTLGDYFLVPNICSGAFYPNPQDWLNAGRVIYADYRDMDSTHPLKAKFLDLTLGKAWARTHNLQMPEFKILCQEFPNFGNDCMMKLIDDRTHTLIYLEAT